MPRMTQPEALERLGFGLSNKYNESSGRHGSTEVSHYTRVRQAGGKPVTQHVFVRNYAGNPGNYDVSYHVTHGPDHQSYDDGYLDHWVAHRSNDNNGSNDPIRDIVRHHHGVNGSLDTEKLPPLTTVGPHNMSLLAPDPSGKGLVSYNSVRDRSIMEKADEDLRP